MRSAPVRARPMIASSMPEQPPRHAERHTRLLLLVILVLALALRLWGLAFGLPYMLQPDEASVIDRTMTMWLTGDLNPHYLTYPSLVYDLQAGWEAAFGHLGGLFDPSLLRHPARFLPSSPVQPFYFVVSRLLTALLGTLAVLVTYLMGRRFSPRIGLIAALFLAVAAIHVQQSHYVTVDATTALCTAATAYLALGLLTADRRAFPQLLVGAGVCAGLAAGTKYNAGLAILMPLAAIALTRWWPQRWLPAALGVLTVFALTFLLTTPFALLDRPLLAASLQSVFAHYTGGQAGAEGNDNALWYLGDLATRGIGAPMTALALLGVPWVVVRFRARGLIVLCFALPYYALLCSTIVRFDRNLLPVLPFLALCAACAADSVAALLGRLLRSTARGYVPVLLVAAGPSLYVAAYGDQLSDYALAHRFTEQVAAAWADAHLPDHATVATENWEGRVFDLSPRHFRIHWAASLGDEPFSSLLRARVQYVITDSFTDGEYEGDARRFPVQAARYRALRQHLKVLAVITSDGPQRPGPTMTIYQMLPAGERRAPGTADPAGGLTPRG